MRAALGIILLVLSGCGAPGPRPDPFIPAIDAGYPTAEIRACGKLWHGQGICQLKPGEKLAFSVQGYFSGLITAFSQECGINLSRRYENSERIQFSISRPSRNCVIAITLTPEFPGQKGKGVAVSGQKGVLAVFPTDGSKWVGEARRVTGNWRATLRATIGGSGSVRVALAGCGPTFDRELELDSSGRVQVPLHQAMQVPSGGRCAATGVVISPRYKDVLLAAVVSSYRTSNFAPLPLPIVRGFELEGDGAVSAIHWDGGYELSNRVKFKERFPPVVRLLTAGGRSVIGQWNGKEWAWMQ